MAVKILIVDDEPRYLRLLSFNLVSEGYDVITAINGEDGLQKISESSPDLIILDIVMPRLDGIATCERIRQYSNVPIMIISAKNEDENKVQALNAGADDYVIKPYSATEVLARVRALLRRSQIGPGSIRRQIFTNGSIKIDYSRAEVYRGDKQVILTPTEFKLLVYFAERVGNIVTADELLVSTWGDNYKDDKEILWVSIARLRQKLEENPHAPQYIITRAGLGYLMPIING
jgi:DNA-binding response OmpR family regulator